MDFIVACSNLRAENYDIAPADRHKVRCFSDFLLDVMEINLVAIYIFVLWYVCFQSQNIGISRLTILAINIKSHSLRTCTYRNLHAHLLLGASEYMATAVHWWSESFSLDWLYKRGYSCLVNVFKNLRLYVCAQNKEDEAQTFF